MTDDILKQIKVGEVSGVQFKERILDKYDIACELWLSATRMVADLLLA